VHGRARVCVVERRRDRLEQLDDAAWLSLRRIGEHVVEGLSGDDLGDQIRAIAVVGKLVQARDRGVVQRNVGAKLEKEAPRVSHVPRGGGADGAQGDLLLEPRMLRLVDGAQAVLIDLTQDAESAVLDRAVFRVGHASRRKHQNNCATTASIELVSLGYGAPKCPAIPAA